METRSVLNDCQKAYAKARIALPNTNGNVLETTAEYRLKVQFIRSLLDRLLAETMRISQSKYSGEYYSLFKLISLALISQATQVGFAAEFCSIVFLELLKSSLPNRIEYIGLSGLHTLQVHSDYGMVVVNRAKLFPREDDRLTHLHNWGDTITIAPHHAAPFARHGNELTASDIKPPHMANLVDMAVIIEFQGCLGKPEWETVRDFMFELATLVNKKFVKKHLATMEECEKFIVPSQLAGAFLAILRQFIGLANEKAHEPTTHFSQAQSAQLFQQQKQNQSRSTLPSQGKGSSVHLSGSYSF
jgi:hypothetical protein